MGRGRRRAGDEARRPYGLPFLVTLGFAGAAVAILLTPLFPAEGLGGRLPFVIGVVTAWPIASVADTLGVRRRRRRGGR